MVAGVGGIPSVVGPHQRTWLVFFESTDLLLLFAVSPKACDQT